jgi:hypothetical protein
MWARTSCAVDMRRSKLVVCCEKCASRLTLAEGEGQGGHICTEPQCLEPYMHHMLPYADQADERRRDPVLTFLCVGPPHDKTQRIEHKRRALCTAKTGRRVRQLKYQRFTRNQAPQPVRFTRAGGEALASHQPHLPGDLSGTNPMWSNSTRKPHNQTHTSPRSPRCLLATLSFPHRYVFSPALACEPHGTATHAAIYPHDRTTALRRSRF